MIRQRIPVKTRWFLAGTAVMIAWELVSAFDDDPETMPWTDVIVGYVPLEIFAVALGGLGLWLPVHFGLRYWRKRRGDSPEPPPPR